ncbi:MAG TPA: replicative DNA helicase [Polyangiaceae bacterium]|jgi:replicative DNA helicase
MAEVIDFASARERQGDQTADGEGRVPPMDLDAEAATICAIMLDPQALPRVQAIGFQPEHAYSEAHRRIVEAAYDLARAGKPTDVVTVGSWLKDHDRIAQVGGMAYLTELLNAAPTTTRIEDYAAIVFEKWRARQIIALAARVAAEGYLGVTDVQAWADGAARSIGAIAARSIGTRCETNVETIKRLLAETRERSQNRTAKVPGIPTGFASLDRAIGGLHANWKFTVCALSNVGKTAFAMQAAINVARLGLGVQIFITEGSRDEWFQRAIAQTAHVDFRKLKAGRMSDGEWTRVTDASTELSKLPIWIDATTSLHIGQVRSALISRAESALRIDKVPLGLAIVDHIHRLEPAPEVARQPYRLQLKHATQTLKATLKRLRIPGIELAQMRDNPIDPKTKTRARPGPGFVAECRDIEREADAVLYLHQKPLHNPKGTVIGEDRRAILGILSKVRAVDNDDIEFGYIVEESRFVDECGQVDDTIDQLIPPTRAMMNQPDSRLPPERDEPTFTTEDL